jgi:predicted choloylglycine hydrolase
MQELIFYGINEPVPGARWRQLFDATWPGYRGWFLSEGDRARPPLLDARRALRRHLPELVPTWEGLVDLTGGDATAARMLTLFDPPRFLPGCSQLVLVEDGPLLVRNYDYRPDLCERVVYSSAFTGRRVIGTGDCLWGLLDGMNDAGLAVSLTSVSLTSVSLTSVSLTSVSLTSVSLASGRHAAGPTGFGIPLVVRYLLEIADTVPDAIAVLTRVPVNMAYNITLLDARANTATVYVAPGRPPEVFAHRAATNHRGLVPADPEQAGSLRSAERQRALFALLEHRADAGAVVTAFLQPPLYNTDYDRGFSRDVHRRLPAEPRRRRLRVARFELAARVRITRRRAHRRLRPPGCCACVTGEPAADPH